MSSPTLIPDVSREIPILSSCRCLSCAQSRQKQGTLFVVQVTRYIHGKCKSLFLGTMPMTLHIPLSSTKFICSLKCVTSCVSVLGAPRVNQTPSWPYGAYHPVEEAKEEREPCATREEEGAVGFAGGRS